MIEKKKEKKIIKKKRVKKEKLISKKEIIIKEKVQNNEKKNNNISLSTYEHFIELAFNKYKEKNKNLFKNFNINYNKGKNFIQICIEIIISTSEERYFSMLFKRKIYKEENISENKLEKNMDNKVYNFIKYIINMVDYFKTCKKKKI